MLINHGFRRGEVLAVEVIEAGGNVARHFNVLDLIAPHGHLAGAEHKDVGSHQHGVHEQARRYAVVQLAACGLVLVLRGLVGMSAVEQAFARHTGQQPAQLRDFRDVALAIESHLLRVQPGGQPAGGNFQRAALNARRLIAFDERVVVGQKVKALRIRLAAGMDGGTDGAHVVAQVWRARGGNASEDAGGSV